MKKNSVTYIVLGASALVTMAYQNCSKVSFGTVSANEASKLAIQPFIFDANSKVAGVVGADGNPSDPLHVATAIEAATNMVVDCAAPHINADGTTTPRYEYERQRALATAAADPSRLTIPVEFAISFGQKEDGLADWAHKRAILSNSADPKYSMIPVSNGKDTADYNGTSAYYKVDHTQAKQDYIYGRSCFFGTVKIEPQASNPENLVVYADGTERDFWGATESNNDIYHMIRYMYFGWCNPDAGSKCANENSVYGKGYYGQDRYPNRLFGTWPHTEQTHNTTTGAATGATELQIVKLYVADLRDGQFRLNSVARNGHVVQLSESANRGDEVSADAKSDFDLKTLFRNRHAAIWNLSTDYTTSQDDGTGHHRSFSGMVGVPQLLSNLQTAGVTGTLLASQYTPIVLDLGREGVGTSGAFAGSFFNMASFAGDVTQQTAWLSGDFVNDFASLQALTPNRNTGVKASFRRSVEDGFLVLPDANGKVSSSAQMLGDNTVVNGKKYSNGFLALQALANKNCATGSTKDRYLGPWDGDLYARTLKVWVDQNRNGVVDANELKTLRDAGVVAVNTCNVVSNQAQDAFGNGTALRSTFLFNDSGEDLGNNENEIISRLETGVKASGADASFRLAIDLIFQVNASSSLEPGVPMSAFVARKIVKN